MPHRKAMLGQQKLDIPGEPKKPQHVRDGCAVLARALCNLLVAEFVVAHQALERVGNLDRVEVLALDILDECDLHEAIIGVILDNDWDLREAGDLGGAPSAFTGDQLVATDGRAHDQGLDDAVLANGLSEFSQAVCLETAARLERVWVDLINRNAQGPWGRRRLYDGRWRGKRAGAGRRAERPLPSALRELSALLIGDDLLGKLNIAFGPLERDRK